MLVFGLARMLANKQFQIKQKQLLQFYGQGKNGVSGLLEYANYQAEFYDHFAADNPTFTLRRNALSFLGMIEDSLAVGTLQRLGKNNKDKFELMLIQEGIDKINDALAKKSLEEAKEETERVLDYQSPFERKLNIWGSKLGNDLLLKAPTKEGIENWTEITDYWKETKRSKNYEEFKIEILANDLALCLSFLPEEVFREYKNVKYFKQVSFVRDQDKVFPINTVYLSRPKYSQRSQRSVGEAQALFDGKKKDFIHQARTLVDKIEEGKITF